ncbi:MAG: motility associated factor glycosyltransferase family protein [bacterium]
MNDAIFQANLAAIRRMNPQQAEMIAQAASALQTRLYSLLPDSEEHINLLLPDADGIYQPLFPTGNVEEQIQQWLDSLSLNAEEKYTLILLGFGIGLYIRKIRERLPAKSMLAVVEPDVLLFMTAFQNVDLTPILSDQGIHLYIGQKADKAVESIGRELQFSRFLSLPWKMLIHPYLHRIRPEFIEDFSTRWRNTLQREIMYRNARSQHGAQVVMNTLRNMEVIHRCPGIALLYKQFTNIPAVLVSAGPSAEKALPVLKQFGKRFLIACVNTAYPLLRRQGIMPHLVFTMDHHERNILSFELTEESDRTYLVADPRVHPDIMQKFFPRVFVASWRTTLETPGNPAPVEQIPVPQKSGNAIFHWLQSILGEKGDVFGSGSVAVAGFHILARMGCQPIILAGQDLAFTAGQPYASGTIFDNRQLPRDASTAHWVEGIEGQPLATSETLFLYKQLLEHEIQRFGVTVFNTGSGARIQNTITTRMDNIIYEIPRFKGDLFDYLDAFNQDYAPAIPRVQLIEVLKDTLQAVENFIQTAKEGLTLVPPEFSEHSSPLMKQQILTRLEQKIEECTRQHPLVMELLNELLQTIHLEFESNRWWFQIREDEELLLSDKIQAHSRVLDQFVAQAFSLSSLMEECIQRLEH